MLIINPLHPPPPTKKNPPIPQPTTRPPQPRWPPAFCAATSVSAPEASAFLEPALNSFHELAVDADGPDPSPQPSPPDVDDGADSEGLVGGGNNHGDGAARALPDLVAGKRAAGSDWEHSEWVSTFYTGGEKSGMVFRNRSEEKSIVDEVFKPGPAHQQSSSPRSFPGTSRLLTDDGPPRSFDGPKHASFLKEPVKSPATFQGEGRNVAAPVLPIPRPVPPHPPQSRSATAAAAYLSSKQAMVLTFDTHPSEPALINLLRRWIQGEVIPWIHEANVYGDGPAALTARYSPATSAKGELVWYFICAPTKKQGKDTRMSRIAGAGTWKGERTKPVLVGSGRVQQQVGWRQSFSYIPKTRSEQDIRVPWIMHSFGLNNGEDAQGRYLSKVYLSPYKPNKEKAKPWVPPLSVLKPSRRIALAAATTAAAGPSTVSAAATAAAGPSTVSAAATTPAAAASAVSAETATAAAGPSTVSAAATATTPAAASAVSAATATAASAVSAAIATAAASAASAVSAATAAAAAPVSAPTASAATATTAATTAPAAASPSTVSTAAPASATTTAAAGPSSPPRKWIQVQISSSPTKSSHRPKRVYQMMDVLEQEGLDDLCNKRTRLLDQKGWLTIEYAS